MSPRWTKRRWNILTVRRIIASQAMRYSCSHICSEKFHINPDETTRHPFFASQQTHFDKLKWNKITEIWLNGGQQSEYAVRDTYRLYLNFAPFRFSVLQMEWSGKISIVHLEHITSVVTTKVCQTHLRFDSSHPIFHTRAKPLRYVIHSRLRSFNNAHCYLLQVKYRVHFLTFPNVHVDQFSDQWLWI
jgi:hypothetical protein